MEPEWGKYLHTEFGATEFSANTPVPYKNSYKTPQTLGLDRIALVAAAFEKYPNKNVLVIDAGTCITYDFLDKSGTYHGGAISPGIAMRFMALNTFTDRLPLVSTEKSAMDKSNFLGKSTLESIQAGVLVGVSHEITGFVEAYCEKHPDLTIILTGGDVQTLSKSIKNTIFAPAYFLLEGLNSILEFNKPK
jgi:type III pantothenate kinase